MATSYIIHIVLVAFINNSRRTNCF